MNRRLTLSVLALAFSAVGRARAEDLSIEHRAVTCVAVDLYPRLEATIRPADNVASARLYFQGPRSSEWFWVAMKREGGVFRGVLPKPTRAIESFKYYVEATDRRMATRRTPDAEPRIAASVGECRGAIGAATMATASVVLQGGTTLPVGFAPAGVTIAGSTAGMGGAVAAAAAGGGGIGATTLVVGGVVALGGAAAVAVKASHSGDEGSCCARPPLYSLSFSPSPPGLDVTPCSPDGKSITFNSQGIELDSAGNFNNVWSPSTPVVRASGQLTATSVRAILACTNGAGPTGSVSATGSNGSYTGTFEFGSSRGQVSIVRSN